MIKPLKNIKPHRSHLEGLIWITGLFLLIISNPYENSHYSLCLMKNCGLNFCPGCGIGHSIGFIFRGDFTQSFKSHPLGIFAIAILCQRVYKIFKNNPLIKLEHDEQNY